MASRGFVPCEAWTRERAISRSAAPLRHPFSRSSSRLFQSALGAVPVFREDQQCLDALQEFPGRIPKRSADEKQGIRQKSHSVGLSRIPGTDDSATALYNFYATFNYWRTNSQTLMFYWEQ